MIPLFNTDGQSTCPLGFAMCQNRLAVPTWSWAFEVRPPSRILELGTYGGGFITALAVHAANLGIPVHTWDRMLPDERYANIARYLGVNFHTGDIWTAEAEVAQLIKGPGTTFLLCDGGDKARELATFAPHLKPGDVIAAHDYNDGSGAWPWGEVTAEQGAKVARDNELVPWQQEHFNLAGWLVYEAT